MAHIVVIDEGTKHQRYKVMYEVRAINGARKRKSKTFSENANMKKIKAFLRNVEKQYEDDDVSLNYNRLSFRRQFLYLNLHSLRHTFASLALKNNVDIKSVQNILGHTDASTTLNTYACAYEDKKRSVIKDMEAKWIKISFTTKKRQIGLPSALQHYFLFSILLPKALLHMLHHLLHILYLLHSCHQQKQIHILPYIQALPVRE